MYFEFVLVEHIKGGKAYLYYAPAFTSLKKGDEVIVEADEGYSDKGYVVATKTLDSDTQLDDIDFIMNATGADTHVKKILQKVNYNDLDFSKGDFTLIKGEE